jgi:hypothetical protein
MWIMSCIEKVVSIESSSTSEPGLEFSSLDIGEGQEVVEVLRFLIGVLNF